jgi:hypothetical protein
LADLKGRFRSGLLRYFTFAYDCWQKAKYIAHIRAHGFHHPLKNKLKNMTTNKTLLIALGGAAATAMFYRYLGTEKGKEFLNSASGVLKDLTSKAKEYAKKTSGASQGTDQTQPA